jgi:hypothetical protein
MTKRKKVDKQTEEIQVPFDIALSLTRPDELEKLKRYAAMYIMKYGIEEEETTALEQQESEGK